MRASFATLYNVAITRFQCVKLPGAVAGTSIGISLSALDRADRDELRACLDRLLNCPAFASTLRRGQLLRYIVDRALAGKGDEITEYGIGLDVFGKPPSFDTRIDSTVRSEMSRLRRAIAEYYAAVGRNDCWRLDFPNRAYVPVLTRVADIVRETPVERLESRSRSWARIAIVAAAAVVAGVLGLLAWRTYSSRRSFVSVVVLPFANLTGDSSKDYVADGITEQLTDSLAQIPSLRVVARTSAFQFKGKSADVREIGKRLNVETVVEGSLRQVEGGYRLTVQLNRASDGYHILSRTFDGKASELARLERDAAAPLRSALRTDTSPAKRHLPDPEAYDLYLKSSYIPGLTPESYDRSIDLLSKAIQRDPLYADAYAALAETYASKAVNAAVRPQDFVAPVKAAAQKALDLDASSAPAYAAEGLVDAVIVRNLKRGEGELRRSIELAPGRAKSHNWLGSVLVGAGRFSDGIAELRRGDTMDPLNPAPTVARALYMARRYDESLQECARVLQLHPDEYSVHVLMGLAWEAKGDYQRARDEYGLFDAKVPGTPLYKASMAHLYAHAGETANCRRLLAELEHPEAGQAQPPAFDIATVYAALGNKDQAFVWLYRAYDAGDLWSLKIEPLLDPLRSDPRFDQLLAKAGLATAGT